MTRWTLTLLVLAALFAAGCGSEHERGKYSTGDRPKRGDKSSQLHRAPAPLGATM